MRTRIIETIKKESGCDLATVNRIVTLFLRELHYVAATDDEVTTGAITETYWSFGAEACYHLGGLLMYHDDGTNQPWHQTESLVPETMKRFFGCDEELHELRDQWFSLLEKRRSESR